jgi:hypothetical protein
VTCEPWPSVRSRVRSTTLATRFEDMPTCLRARTTRARGNM